jgi:hypothetical protein
MRKTIAVLIVLLLAISVAQFVAQSSASAGVASHKCCGVPDPNIVRQYHPDQCIGSPKACYDTFINYGTTADSDFAVDSEADWEQSSQGYEAGTGGQLRPFRLALQFRSGCNLWLVLFQWINGHWANFNGDDGYLWHTNLGSHLTGCTLRFKSDGTFGIYDGGVKQWDGVAYHDLDGFRHHQREWVESETDSALVYAFNGPDGQSNSKQVWCRGYGC